jgi:hypothetical protein
MATQTLGDRFAREIKRLNAQYIIAGKKLDTEPQKRQAVKAFISQVRSIYKLPRSLSVTAKYDEIADYRPQITINGISANLPEHCPTRASQPTSAAHNHLLAVRTINRAKKENCKMQAAMNSCLTSTGINAFKAYCKARLDNTDNALGLPVPKFQALVSEFIATRHPATCSIS